jgi:hypothetical protein
VTMDSSNRATECTVMQRHPSSTINHVFTRVVAGTIEATF